MTLILICWLELQSFNGNCLFVVWCNIMSFDDKMWPANSTWSVLKMYFFRLSLSSCFFSRWRRYRRFLSCSCWSFPHIIISPLIFFTPLQEDISCSIWCWNDSNVEFIQYISCLYWKITLCVVKTVMCLLPGCNGIWLYLSLKSSLKKTVALWSSVRMFSSLEMAYLSQMIAVLALRKLRHNLIVLLFLGTGTIGLSQLVGPVTQYMISSYRHVHDIKFK